MGRLFWKFFSFIFLAQLLTILAVGSSIWWRTMTPEAPPPLESTNIVQHQLSKSSSPVPNGQQPQHHQHFPFGPMIGGTLASLISAALLAWYVAKPVHYLRRAVQAAAKGDLTQRVSPLLKPRNDELAELGQDYDHMADQLRALLDSQRRLLHDVSHELRSPLARLQLAIGLAQQRPDQPVEQQIRLLGRIEREATRINLLIGELLTLSRIEVSQQHEEVDCILLLNDIIEDANFEAVTESKLIVWHSELTSACIQGHAELLRRALENVIRNALRFSPKYSEINVSLVDHDATFQILVQDQGPGIRQEELEQVFEPFYRGSQPSQQGGYGLGLAIARRVIEAHGGSIVANNLLPNGLVVTTTVHKIGKNGLS